jgi:putative aldouronate transport system permease protein
MNKRTWGDKIFDTINIFFMLSVFALMVFPFLYIINYSISDPTQVSGELLLIPKNINFDSYRIAFSNPDIFWGIYISISRTFLGAGVMIFFTSMAGYVLSRDDLLAVKFLRKFFVLTLYFAPGIIPLYILINEIQLAGTFLVYILPQAIVVFNLILIKTFIESLPKELEEAALMDGANEIYLFFKIIFPICLPVLAAVTLFSCIFQWNSFIDTQFYNAMNPELWPMQYVLYNALQSISSIEQFTQNGGSGPQHATPASLKMAMTVITVLPIMLVYPILQKYFIKGLLVGAVKG